MSVVTPPPGRELLEKGAESMSRILEQTGHLTDVIGKHIAIFSDLPQPTLPLVPDALLGRTPMALAREFADYATDTAQRSILFWDVLRQAGNTFIEHEAAGCPPVLMFDWTMVVDGRSLPRPVNYALVRITPPADAPQQPDPSLRPFVIIDPRAGHGAGIGGFKSDSQVGVALKRGHPVYFVIFFRDPEPNQTILDVTAAEAEFVRRVAEAHPNAGKPVIIGNCQGGWAAMMLSASEPELTGPLVLNGAPLSYWAGTRGKNPMRYSGGLAGGSWPAAMLADLGNGKFDGANLVLNFESLSPGNTWFRKFDNLFANVDSEADRFLEFERWWGGFFLMTRDEMRWIVENLFVGDRFARGEINSGQGAKFDMRAVKSPVVVFASSGDNITPPGQALRWIADVYRSEQEIKNLGQTIIYLVHDHIGHLGIFVSGAVAKKEHTEIAATLEMIEALAPGLYEMRITGTAGTGLNTGYQVELVERTLADIRAASGDAQNEAFPAVARVAEMNQTAYDLWLGPILRQVATEQSAERRRAMHPLRLRRSLVSDKNPMVAAIAPLAAMVREHRKPAAADNVFTGMERAMSERIGLGIDLWRDMADASTEMAFHAVYGWLAAWGVGTDPADAIGAAAPTAHDVTEAPEVRAALDNTASGGYAEAVIRMMVLLAQARGGVRRNRLARSNALLTGEAPFAEMTANARQALIREQTVIVSLKPEEALAALPRMLPDLNDRRRAITVVENVAGPEDELGDKALAMLERLRAALAVPALAHEAAE